MSQSRGGGRRVFCRLHEVTAAVASPFVNFGHAGETVDTKRWPRLTAYLQRVHARPSFKALIEEERQTFKPA